MHQKLEQDEKLANPNSRKNLYKVEIRDQDEENLRRKFIELNFEDSQTQKFVENSREKSDSILTQIYHNVAKSFLTLFGWTQTDANGILDRGRMFVISREQFQQLAPMTTAESVIDLGAGDGNPAVESFADFFATKFATEASAVMRRSLQAKGFQVLEIDSWHFERQFDLIAALNLLDRCSEPLTLLSQIRSSLKAETGLALIAVVIPFRPYVEVTADHEPVEKLNITGEGFVEQVQSLVNVFESNGFEVIRWSRVPYLCEGDMAQAVYALDDAIFVLKNA